MLDIHTHLYWKSYDADRDMVVERARKAGVKEMLVIGCTVDESRQAIEVAEKYEDMYASVGMHPHEFNDEDTRYKMQDEGWIEKLKELAKNEKVVAVGECGLDYYSHDKQIAINSQQKTAQKDGFLAQIELAQELKLPVILHCRSSSPTSDDAYEDMFEILKAKSYQLKAILHCYMGDTEVTKKFLMLPNLFFSFTGNITYPVKQSLIGTKDDLTETVKLVPLERMFVETDCPFLTPQSKRGERNEPAYVIETAQMVARLKEVDGVSLEQTLHENFNKAFPVNR